LSRLIILILIWCGINTLGEILIKFGSSSLSEPNSVQGILRLVVEVIQNPLVVMGIITCAVDLLLWIYLLKDSELSVVAPLTAINYIFAVAAGCLLFGEVLSVNRVIGILLICGGAFFISR